MRTSFLLCFVILLASCAPVETEREEARADRWRPLADQAVSLIDTGHYAAAARMAKAALAPVEERFGPDLNGIVIPMGDLPYFGFLRSIARDRPDAASSLSNLAGLYRTQGKYAKAEPLYIRSLAIREGVLGKDHPDVATALSNLADLYRLQIRYAEAETLYERSLAITEKALGKEHPNVARILESFMAFFQAQGRYAEAQSIYKRLFKMKAGERDVFELSEVDRPPSAVRKIDPLYPFAAKRNRIQGAVILQLIVTDAGRVLAPIALRGEPPGVFDNSALKAIARWRFKPAVKDGRTVDVITRLPVHFEMSGERVVVRYGGYE